MVSTYQTVPTSLRAQEAPTRPSTGALRPWEPAEFWPIRNVLVAQDTIVPCARRALISFGLKGSDQWPIVDNPAGGEVVPDPDEWRTVYPETACSLTPGSFLRLHVLHAPCSGTRGEVVGGRPVVTFASGAIRLVITWVAANGTTSGPHTHALPLDAPFPDGELPSGAGQLWGQIYESELAEIWPPGVDGSRATSHTFSEGCTALVAVQLQGGARIIDCTVVEHPWRHVQRHDDTDPVSVHGVVDSDFEGPQTEKTARPQTRRRGSLTKDERRWGTEQTLRTADKQYRAFGPRILAWSSWRSVEGNIDATNSLGEVGVEPVVITGDSPTEILSGASSYDPDGPGWVVHCAHAQIYRYSFSEGRAVVPVRVRVRARWNGGGDGGRVRVQSSPTEWIDVLLPDDGMVGEYEAIGYLECQAAADQPTAICQAFTCGDGVGDSIEVYALTVDWGW